MFISGRGCHTQYVTENETIFFIAAMEKIKSKWYNAGKRSIYLCHSLPNGHWYRHCAEQW